MQLTEGDLASATVRRVLSGRQEVRVLAAMGPQQPDGLIRLVLDTALAMKIPVVLLFADLEGRLAFLDEAMRPDIEAGRIKLLALAGAVPRRWGALVDYFPDSLWSIDRMIARGEIAVDLVLARVWARGSGAGYDYGAMIGYTHTALETGAAAAFEVTPPTIAGLRASVSIADGRAELVCHPQPSAHPDGAKSRGPSGEEHAVARLVASLIPPRATLQIGIGGIGNAIAEQLAKMPGIGLHSGIIPASLREAICTGVIDGTAKSVERGMAVTTGILGQDSPDADWQGKVELQPISQTHAPDRLRAHDCLWAVNSAMEVDLSGQVNAEFAGGQRLASGGGQVDFVRGARLAGGASVIAITARTRDGRARIVAALPAGNPPTTQAQDVDYVVTEFGIAKLRGRSMAERRAALAAIAHPEDRAALFGAVRCLCPS